jgi:hypothetical protein
MFNPALFTLTFLRRRFIRRVSEWYFAAVMTAIGIILLDGNTFDLQPYALIRDYADQTTWALWLTFIGSARLVVLLINGGLRRGSPHLRIILASVSSLIWLTFFVCTAIATTTPLMLGPFLAGATIFDLINCYRAAQDARREDDESGVRHGQPG